jgi:hypothetical protein
MGPDHLFVRSILACCIGWTPLLSEHLFDDNCGAHAQFGTLQTWSRCIQHRDNSDLAISLATQVKRLDRRRFAIWQTLHILPGLDRTIRYQRLQLDCHRFVMAVYHASLQFSPDLTRGLSRLRVTRALLFIQAGWVPLHVFKVDPRCATIHVPVRPHCNIIRTSTVDVHHEHGVQKAAREKKQHLRTTVSRRRGEAQESESCHSTIEAQQQP